MSPRKCAQRFQDHPGRPQRRRYRADCALKRGLDVTGHQGTQGGGEQRGFRHGYGPGLDGRGHQLAADGESIRRKGGHELGNGGRIRSRRRGDTGDQRNGGDRAAQRCGGLKLEYLAEADGRPNVGNAAAVSSGSETAATPVRPATTASTMAALLK